MAVQAGIRQHATLSSISIYTNSQHNNPLCRAVPIENIQKEVKTTTLDNYDRKVQRNGTRHRRNSSGILWI